jgi:hypothetical protein
MNYEKHWVWNFTKLGILIFPLFPLLGGIAFGITLIYLWKKEFKNLINLPLTKGLSISLGLALKNYYNSRKNKLIFSGLVITIYT